ncbi:MAG: hypothetical protein ABJF01_01520 [bacterium]
MSSTHISHINRWNGVVDAPAPRWRALGASVAVTTALFAAAITAMTSFRALTSTSEMNSSERVAWVPVAIPIPAPLPPREQPRRVAPAPVAEPITRVQSSSSVGMPTASTMPAAPSINARIRRDSSAIPQPPIGTRIPLSVEPATPIPFNPPAIGVAGAPVAPAGVVLSHAPMSVQARDSTLAALMASVPGMARAGGSGRSGGTVRAIPITQPGAPGQQQPAVCVCVSLPLPILEPGPSAAQRKRDAVIAADNQARLTRLEERLREQRDSMRLDSLRKDSLRRDSIAAKARPPRGSADAGPRS